MIMYMTNVNPRFEFSDVDVLEFVSRPYTNKKGENVVYTTCLLRIDSKVFRFGLIKDVDLSDFVGKKVSLAFEITSWGDDLTPNVRVAEVL